MNTRTTTFLAITGIVAGLLLSTACDGDDKVVEPGSSTSSTSSSTSSSGQPPITFDAGTLPDGAPKDCFDNPKTHFELINGCTNADQIDRRPTLNKLLPDGGLPPLQ
ncbi:MAG: hypothetical protein KIT84_38945 [Labilithrix sp.]|nr:hypothetical protein [Labilithrix sp.]MCW5817040.1 hypothetical protein [Labilithrix sp.]